jgi:hypothetical protein
VLRAVREDAPDTRITVVSLAPEALFRSAVPGELTYRRVECDVGLVQRDALSIDVRATAEACRVSDGWDERVEREGRWLGEVGTQVVLGDIPPLAFAAAATASVPSVALANFSWDWIYTHLSRSAADPDLAAAARQAKEAYGQASLLLRLPFAGDLSAFPRVEDIPLVARRPRLEAEESRRRLGLGSRPAVLMSFGGIGLDGPAGEVLGVLGEFDFVVDSVRGEAPLNVRVVDEATRRALGLGYEDVVAAADVVVTKPGYGIVTDAIAGRTRIVYTERGDFPEYPILVAEMPRYVPSVHVGNDDLRAGRLSGAIRAVLAQPFPDPPSLDGALVAARRILSRAGRG